MEFFVFSVDNQPVLMTFATCGQILEMLHFNKTVYKQKNTNLFFQSEVIDAVSEINDEIKKTNFFFCFEVAMCAHIFPYFYPLTFHYKRKETKEWERKKMIKKSIHKYISFVVACK